MFNGKTHYKWQCSIAMLVYQRVPWGIISVAHELTTWGTRDIRPETMTNWLMEPPPLELRGQTKRLHEPNVHDGCYRVADFISFYRCCQLFIDWFT